jgi:hypothetical protein
MASVRDTISDNVKSMFESITTSNNYNTDAGENVVRVMRQPGEIEVDGFPAIVLQASNEQLRHYAAGQKESTLSIDVYGFVTGSEAENLDSDLQKLTDDMIEAILTDERLGLTVDMIDEWSIDSASYDGIGVSHMILPYIFERNVRSGANNIARRWYINDVLAGSYTFGVGVTFANVANDFVNAPHVEFEPRTDASGYVKGTSLSNTGFVLVDSGTGSETLQGMVIITENL